MTKKSGMPVMRGILQKKRKGFGFVMVEGKEQDIHIASSRMHDAMNGDLVEIRLLPKRRYSSCPEGEILRIRQRAVTEIAGVLQESGKDGKVVPQDYRIQEEIWIPKRYFAGAKPGDTVVAEVIHYPSRQKGAEGRIIQILRRKGEADGDILALARQRGMTLDFSSTEMAAASHLNRNGLHEEDLHGRMDLRQETIVTIDGADAKDFDDAVSCKKTERGHWKLGVHIADVGHYVRQNGSLDREAFRRGTSVYLLRQVIPMLPLPLSHGICSLNPEEDRLTISCDMELDPEGRVIQYRIFESVIRSSARLVYEDVSDLLEGKPVTDPALQALEHPLKQMAELAAVLRKRRQEQGSLDFDLDESDIVLDKSGAAVSVGRRDRRIANCMIEEFMLLANQVVAINAVQHHIPIIYRVHGRPDAEKFTVFSDFLRSMRMRIPADKKVTPLMLQQILAQVKGTPIENVVNTLMLRSMQKASYDAECRGHFGLAMPYYCHFTSPIRRYPDLCVHRALKAWLHGGEEWTEWKSQSGRLQDVAESCSQAERRAIELEREVEKIKKAEYMTHHLGECEEGIVSGVTSFGIYVTLPNTVEGMIRLESMTEDIYQLDETQFRLTGIHTGRVFCLGDAIRIRVWQADPARGEIDFILADQSVHRLI